MTDDRWSAIERIFHEALERPEEARAAFVEASCGDDENLRREVRSLLDESSNTGFLEQPLLRVAAGLAETNTANLTGQRIGAYLVQSLLGKGGMGEVYRARDTRLDREVAIKVLPRAFTADPDRLARFEREARVLASLNHPHIGMIHGLEEGDGTRALVLELVEGDTLADRINRGPVTVKQALTWARQIADALDAAHEKGIVHRDLKPANVKITPHGVVKVLDFGLARTYTTDSDNLTRSPTITSDGGVILGTAAYMSPEQARGHPLGKRADIWAFGCVLYELLTGRVAFDGASVSDTIAAVLHHEPDWAALPPNLSPAVRTLLQRCLEKDVQQRRRDIADVRAELDDAIAQPSAAGRRQVAVAASGHRRSLWRVVVPLAAVVAAALAGVFTTLWWGRADPPGDTRFLRITDFIGLEESPAVSFDGKEVAFVSSVGGRRQIWGWRPGRSPVWRVTRDNVDHDFPRWLPDNSGIIYFSASAREGDPGTISEIPALGGAERHLTKAMTGADVSADWRIAAFQATDKGVVLSILDRKGAVIDSIAPPPAVEYLTPRWSPDGHAIAFVTNETDGAHVLNVIDVNGNTLERIARALRIRGITWLPDGSGLVFASSAGSTMWYPPVFHLRRVSRHGGGEVQLTPGDVSYVDPEMGQAGKLFASGVRIESQVWRFPVSGSPLDNVKEGTQVTQQTGQVQTPSASPDGNWIVYLSDSGGHSNLWVARLDGTDRRQVTFEQDPEVSVGLPIWSPSGEWIAFIRARFTQGRNRNSEWIVRPDGNDERLIADGGSSAAWSTDGRSLYYQKYAPPESCIYRKTLDIDASEVRVLCNAGVPTLSADSLFYSPGGPGNANEIFKTALQGRPGQFLTRYARSRMPLWPTGSVASPDGRWLALPLKDGGTSNIWAISTETSSSKPAAYRQITDFGPRAILIARQVSWSKDGKFIYAAVAESDSDVVLFDSTVFARDPDRPPR